jgi:hypothetical protein
MIEDIGMVAAGTSAVSVTLNPKKNYELHHTGSNGSTADSNNVIVGTASGVGNSIAASTTSGPLIYGQPPILLRPGLSTIYLRCASGAPFVRIVASASWLGQF